MSAESEDKRGVWLGLAQSGMTVKAFGLHQRMKPFELNSCNPKGLSAGPAY